MNDDFDHMGDTNMVDKIFIDIIKFTFHRYAASHMPTDQQIVNAIQDYRQAAHQKMEKENRQQ